MLPSLFYPPLIWVFVRYAQRKKGWEPQAPQPFSNSLQAIKNRGAYLGDPTVLTFSKILMRWGHLMDEAPPPRKIHVK
ncbi:MAG: hypothetical protein DRH12_09415 [Deltaproteobacteria bacterium]|nr:MAG: hypothetical protein DRH12_09415 [Deltaproteobacteria bacterium]